jgi:hypothetical protein
MKLFKLLGHSPVKKTGSGYPLQSFSPKLKLSKKRIFTTIPNAK